MALDGAALATLDDPGVRPDAHAFIADKALWFTVTDDLPQYPARIPGQNAPPQFLTGRSHAIAVRAATLNVCWSFVEGTFAEKRGNGRDAPFSAIRRALAEGVKSTQSCPSAPQPAMPAHAPRAAIAD